jgi:hypothetical protein
MQIFFVQALLLLRFAIQNRLSLIHFIGFKCLTSTRSGSFVFNFIVRRLILCNLGLNEYDTGLTLCNGFVTRVYLPGTLLV